MTSATKKFDDSLTKIVVSRGEDYGHPADDFRRASVLKRAVAECADPEMRHAMEMICVKLARLIKHPTHFDSIRDIAGYARTMAMILDKRKDRHED